MRRIATPVVGFASCLWLVPMALAQEPVSVETASIETASTETASIETQGAAEARPVSSAETSSDGGLGQQRASLGEEDPSVPETPWQKVGLNERQGAVHLLNRLTFGPRPGDIDRLLAMGLDNWIERQLLGDSAGSILDATVADLPVMALDADGLTDRYPHHSYVVSEAIAAGVMKRRAYQGHDGEAARRRAEASLDAFARSRGFQPQAEVLWQLQAQKLYHALLSQAQLREVLTDFWFNHFNVAARGEVRAHVVSYEDEAIRPFVLGDFASLLRQTAQHPAMLYYLGNVHSVADQHRATPFDAVMEGFEAFSPGAEIGLRRRLEKALPWYPLDKRMSLGRARGLNENYARELLELHTLGVEGGYDQQDVVDVARAFTGWTVLPQGTSQKGLRQLLRTAAEDESLGFVIDGELVFRPDLHDGEAKRVLGHQLPPGRGFEDGLEVLALLAKHPATARHLSRKLAVRFVADEPPEALVRRLAETFLHSGGDLRRVMEELIYSPEFWQSALEPAKLKSPFELVVSALRATDAEVEEPKVVMYWVRRVGQASYLYGAPTGFPDDGESWVHGGAMLQRVNFALALARDRIAGVRFDRLALLAGLEPASQEDTVATLMPAILPERLPGDELAELAGLSRAVAKEFIDPLAGDASARAAALRRARLERNMIYALAVLLASPEFQFR